MADKEYSPDEEPDTADLEEPSTEKDPGEETKAATDDEPEPHHEEPSHEAIGIGVVEHDGTENR